MRKAYDPALRVLRLTAAEAAAPSGRFTDVLKRGLPARAFDEVAKYTKLGRARLGAVTRISSRTIERRIARKDRFAVDESERLARVARMYALAESVLGGKDAAERWMASRNRALDGARPVEELVTDLGAREVEDLLGRIRDGIFA
ncbi:MAG TPA: antitoxin Xre/MbcA/ParS toxin-binding domain-containing protein [Candidatus Tyrphobacter sp.]